MKFGVVQFPGSNCDYDCYYALKNILKAPVEMIWHKEKEHNLRGMTVSFFPGDLAMVII
jgi:phosphoribosylformylglycinamidine synthase